ncbi:nitric oxide-sensing protein NosP [Vogesella amnigena]|uniref:Nitric oxide-sensing protein NosP n=1 Tax=Vogesella amnigena TaxID=1507449 RepID=A0ABV7TNX9_9NEIS
MITNQTQPVRRCHVYSADPEQAADELYQQLWQPDCSLVLLFVAPDYQLDKLAPALARRFGDVPVVGCTTAGEISPDGYRCHSIVGASFAAPDFFSVIKRIDTLPDFDLSDALGTVMAARYALGQKCGFPLERRTFALLLVDGLSAREEQLAGRLARALGDIPICGGSAGDNMRFERTHVLVDGEFVSDSAVLVLVATRHPFEVFKSEHTVRSGERLVVTEADSERRLVTEINAEPAAAEYARMLGVSPEKLSPLSFAAHPLVLNVGGVPYVRSIQRINPDLSLSFFCAVDEGIVLSGTRAVDIVDNLANTFRELRGRLGQFQIVLGFDCILRTLPLMHSDAIARLSGLLAANAVVGFSTYGEQYQAMHVNQTFTGIAIGYGHGDD